MPIKHASDTQQSSRKKRRLRRTLLVSLAAVAALTAPTVGAAADAEGGGAPRCDKQLIAAAGKGKVTGSCPSASTAPPAPAAGSFRAPTRAHRFVRERSSPQSMTATPPRPADACPPPSRVSLRAPDDAITQVGEGTVCPNGAGGHVFTGRVGIAGVSGRSETSAAAAATS